MNRRVYFSALLLVVCCAVWAVSCVPEHQPEHEYVYRIPEQTNDGWGTASLDDVGMREDLLGDLMMRIHSKEYQNVHGILIVKNGQLVFEEYFEGYTFSYTGPWSSVLKFRGDRTDFGYRAGDLQRCPDFCDCVETKRCAAVDKRSHANIPTVRIQI